MKYQVYFLLTFLALILALNYICEAGGGHSMRGHYSARNLIQDFEQQDKPSRPIQHKLNKANARSINFGNQGRQSSKDISARAFLLNEPLNEEATGRLIKSGRRQLKGIAKADQGGKRRLQRSSRRQLQGVGKARSGKKQVRKSRSFQARSQKRFKRRANQECDCSGQKSVGREIGAPIELTLMNDMRQNDLNRAFDTSSDFDMRSSKKESLTDRLFGKWKPKSNTDKPVDVKGETNLVEETISEQREFENSIQETPSLFEKDTSSSLPSSPLSSTSLISTSGETELVDGVKGDIKKDIVEVASLETSGGADLNNKVTEKINEKLESGKEEPLIGAEIAALETPVSAIQNKEDKMENLAEGKERFLDQATDLKAEIGAKTKDKGEEFLNAKENLIGAISNDIKTKENLIGEAVDAKKEVLNGAISNDIKNKENFIGEVVDANEGVLNSAVKLGENAFTNLKDNVEKVVDSVKEKEEKLVEKIAEKKEDASKKVADNIAEKVGDVKEKEAKLVEKIAEKKEDTLKKVADNIAEEVGDVKEEVTKIKGKKIRKRPNYRRPIAPLYQPYQQKTIIRPPKNSYNAFPVAFPSKCYVKILELEVKLVELLELLEKLNNLYTSDFSNYKESETKEILYQLSSIRRAVEDSFYAIKSRNLELLAVNVQKVGRELSQLSSLSKNAELEHSLPKLKLKLRKKYSQFRKSCGLAH